MIEARDLLLLQRNPAEPDRQWLLDNRCFILAVVVFVLAPSNPGARGVISEQVAQGWDDAVGAFLVLPAAVPVRVDDFIEG